MRSTRTDLELNVRQTAILLRCQTVRETRCRRDAISADHARAAAERDALARAEEVRVHQSATASRLFEAHERLLGQVVGPETIGRLAEMERELTREADGRAAASRFAEDHAIAARAAAAVARGALAHEARVTLRRARLADEATRRWVRSVEAAEEAARDDGLADGWRTP